MKNPLLLSSSFQFISKIEFDIYFHQSKTFNEKLQLLVKWDFAQKRVEICKLNSSSLNDPKGDRFNQIRQSKFVIFSQCVKEAVQKTVLFCVSSNI